MIRSASAVLLLSLCFACAHAHPPPLLVVTGTTLHGARLAFEATAAGMDAANNAGKLTDDQREAWNAFLPKFRASFRLAVELWKAAQDTQDQSKMDQASAIIATLLSELASFTKSLSAGDSP